MLPAEARRSAWKCPSCPPSPERQLQLEARVGAPERIPEELPQADQPIADRLRVQVERSGHRRGVAAMLHERERRLLHPLTCGRGELGKRRKPAAREPGGEPAGLE